MRAVIRIVSAAVVLAGVVLPVITAGHAPPASATALARTCNAMFPEGSTAAGITEGPDGGAYWLFDTAGDIAALGEAACQGSSADNDSRSLLNGPVVAMAATADGSGYWTAAADGGVFAFGSAPFLGSLGGLRLAAPIVGIAALPDGSGYWLVASDGGVFSFGAARFHGSLGGVRLAAPIVGMAAAPDRGGYWLVAADGGVFTFGSARFAGSLGGVRLAAPIVGIAAAGDGSGYWLAAADGGVFTFGAAPYLGSLGGVHLAARVVGIAAHPDGLGYRLAAADGGVFAFGSTPFDGAAPVIPHCTASQLSVALSNGPDMGAGSQGAIFTITRTAPGPVCSMDGSPQVIRLDASGRPFPLASTGFGRSSAPVFLTEGGEASFSAETSDGAGFNRPCNTSSSALQVVPPRDTGRVTVSPSAPMLSCFPISASPVLPGPFGSR